MKKHSISGFILLATVAALAFFSCIKEAPDTIEKDAPNIPDGSRVAITFATSTLKGCMHTFSDCIVIRWDTRGANANGAMALEFGDGAEASQFFGNYFPLTEAYKVTKAEAEALGIEAQEVPAGFYPIQDVAGGELAGKRMVIFTPEVALPVTGVVNPDNPQDIIGQLHNYCVQAVLHDNHEALNSLKDDKRAIQTLLVEQVAQLLSGVGVPASTAEMQRALAIDVHRDYGNYAARLNETRLSANDKNALKAIFDEAAALPVRSPRDLSTFVSLLTERENQLAHNGQLDNRKTVLTMLSVLKHSRYYWYWRSISLPDTGTGTPQPTTIPDWVWADVIGMELGGPLVSAIASAAVYLDKH